MLQENITVRDKGVSTRTQLIVFRLGTEDFALMLDEIKEVVLTPAVTTIPQTPDYIKGVANIRGSIITIFDLEEKFALAENEGVHGKYTLVSESQKFKIGILVKNVPDTLTVDRKVIEDNVGIVQGDGDENGSYVKGIIKLNEKLVILLDLQKAISEKEVGEVLSRIRVT